MKMTTTENIRKELQTLADSKYQEFHSSLLPGANNILGVRIPQLRTMAKEIIKKEDWRTFVESTDTIYYEETMLQGMIIGLAKMELEEQMKYVTMFIPRIDNWAVCDIFCSELKTSVKKGKENVWQFIQPYLKYADSFNHDAYYARMAMAWMISLCFIKFPQKTMEYLKHSTLDNWTYNKALQKTIESFRVDKDTKDILREMKRR